MSDDLYYRKLESTSTTDLVDMIREKDKRIEELEQKLEKETAQRIYNFNKAIEWKEKHRVLKKENAELEQKLEQAEKDLADYQFNYPTIKELQKENAELKKKYVKNITDCDICDTYCNSQLTKAKEIIREFVEWATWQGSKCPSFKSIQDKAEQFLKDCEVEK